MSFQIDRMSFVLGHVKWPPKRHMTNINSLLFQRFIVQRLCLHLKDAIAIRN